MITAASRNSFRIAAIAGGLFLPAITLMPLGSLWLWQQGYLLYWAVIAAIMVVLASLLQWWVFKSDTSLDVEASATRDEYVDPGWSPSEAYAWTDVERIAAAVDIAGLDTREAIFELGAQTVRAVAHRIHPEVTEPLLQFTAPEAFAIVERVSARLGKFTADNIPLSDRMTVAQVLAVYRWRGALGVAEKAYDVWRLMRLVNPLAAVTHELRERMSKQLLNMGRAHIAQRLAAVYVKEVGRAAIDLYGGRLRVSAERLESKLSEATKADDEELQQRREEPLRIMIAGKSGAGKSSLVNALANEVHAAVDSLPTPSGFNIYELRNADFPSTRIIDTPGLAGKKSDLDALIAKSADCDLILWVVPADRADREVDRVSIAAIRKMFLAMPHRRVPPMILVLTHIDRLRPFADWAPPYDLSASETPKAVSIRNAVNVIAADLQFSVADAIPIRLSSLEPYNIDALWSRMCMVLPDAQRAQLVRRLHDAKTTWDWQHIWSQAMSGGRVIGQTLKP